MAYDIGLADRIRELLAARDDVTEQAMFGGLAFLVDGHMAVAASGQGGLLVRVEPAETPRLISSGAATIVEMGGRSRSGWLRVPADGVRTKRQLTRWVRLGVERVGSLPAKPAKAKAKARTAGTATPRQETRRA